MMHRLAFAVLFAIAIMLAVSHAAMCDPAESKWYNNDGDFENGDLYGFFYESYIVSPGDWGGQVIDDWYYDYYLENRCYVHTIESWTWEYLGRSGDVMPNPNPAATVGGYDWPLVPSTGPNPEDTAWREEDFFDPRPAFSLDDQVKVMSKIVWDDQTVTADLPIYIPSLPEPGSLLAMATGIIGLAGLMRRKLI